MNINQQHMHFSVCTPDPPAHAHSNANAQEPSCGHARRSARVLGGRSRRRAVAGHTMQLCVSCVAWGVCLGRHDSCSFLSVPSSTPMVAAASIASLVSVRSLTRRTHRLTRQASPVANPHNRQGAPTCSNSLPMRRGMCYSVSWMPARHTQSKASLYPWAGGSHPEGRQLNIG